MKSPVLTNHALPRPSYRLADPTLRANRSGSICRPSAVGLFRSDRRSYCGVVACGIRFREQNPDVRLPKAIESSIDSVADAPCCLSSVVDDPQPPSHSAANFPEAAASQLLQPLATTDLSQPGAPMQEPRLRVAYQGLPGSHSEVATERAYSNCEAIPCDQFGTVFMAVELGVVDRAIIPVENSIGGLIHHNHDLLLKNHLHIVGEVNLPIHHCLLTLPGICLEQLSRVISHPQALAQCENSLTKLIPGAAFEAVDDTAGAAEFIATNELRDTAAIASVRAAEIFGLQVLAGSIEDDSSNVTRFVKLARAPCIPTTVRPFKTSVVIGHDKRAGVLFEMLSMFESHGISLTKVVMRPRQSRPIRIAGKVTANLFRCLSYMDLVASLAEKRMQDALAEVREVSSFLRVLGSYPMDVTHTGW